MSKFDVFIPAVAADYQEYLTSVYAETMEEAEELAMKALEQLDAMAPDTDYNNVGLVYNHINCSY